LNNTSVNTKHKMELFGVSQARNSSNKYGFVCNSCPISVISSQEWALIFTSESWDKEILQPQMI